MTRLRTAPLYFLFTLLLLGLPITSWASDALQFDFSTVQGAAIRFPGDGTFVFRHSSEPGYSPFDFEITNQDGFTVADELLSLQGRIDGTFKIGPVTTIGTVSSASVSGTGDFYIFDGTDTFSAKLQWVDISQNGTGSEINTTGTVNLTSFVYSGSNPNLQELAARPDGIVVVTFQFVPSVALSVLRNGPGAHETSMSGSVYSNGCTSAIGNFVWNDLNHDGIQQPGEPGIPNITVQLWNSDHTSMLMSTTTDASGFYHFTGLCGITYQVEVPNQPGLSTYVASPAFVGGNPENDSNSNPFTVTLPDDTTDNSIDFGYYMPNPNLVVNKTPDGGTFTEGSQTTFQIQVSNTGGSPAYNVHVTDQLPSSGGLLWTGVTPAGSCTISLTNLLDCNLGTIQAGSSVTITVSSALTTAPEACQLQDNPVAKATGSSFPAGNTDLLAQDSGSLSCKRQPAISTTPSASTATTGSTISDTALVSGGNSPTGSVTFKLYGPGDAACSGAVLFTDVEPLTGGAATSAGYAALTAGTYNWIASYSGDANNLAATGSCGQESVVIYQPASLGDYVWNDLNANGQQDSGEPGIPGVPVTLLKCDNTVVSSTVTDGNGLYLFTNLEPGCYKVKFGTPAGFIATAGNVGSDVTDSDAGPGGVTGDYTLNAGDNNTTVDAGFYKLASLGDFVWNDLNANGQQDSGEPGIPGVTVTLLKCDNTTVGSTLTDATGLYAFTNLVPGCYKVRFTTPGGFTPTGANVGADISDSDAAAGGLTGDYTLNSGDNNTTVDAGFFKPASLGDFVWTDLNGNGQQDSGEPGIPGVTVTLFRCDNTLVGSTTTNGNGLYAFTNLVPGCYKVQFGTPAGYTPTGANVGSDVTDSDAASGGVTNNYTLISGENNITIDAGFVFVSPPTASCVAISAVQGIAIAPVTMTGSGGAGGPYTFAAVGLPDGLTISVNGTISGTPTVTGPFNYTVIVTDKNGNVGTFQCSVIVKPPQICYVGTTHTQVTASQTWTTNVDGTITIHTVLSRNFVDNTYGTSAIGWPSGHKFSDLTGSDQLTLALYDKNGVKVMEFKQDYISATTVSARAPSGYQSLGVTGGDGGMLLGSASDVVSAKTSLDDNFNKYGYVLTNNSPQTDSNYTPNASYPNWIYDVWYDVTVKASAFGSAGFGKPVVSGVHASPSKTGTNTETVVVTPCPQLTAACVTATTGQTGVPYSSSITATYGSAPYLFTLAAGSLPPGLQLNTQTGVISGTPTTTGAYPFSVLVMDAAGATAMTSSCGINISDNSTSPPQLCYVGTTHPQVSASQIWTVNPDGTITIRTTLSRSFVDNTYGTNAVGWPSGHKFGDLTGSDQLTLALYDKNGVKKMEFKQDYISATTVSARAPSGYMSLGVTGGDGGMLVGSASDVVSAKTSLDDNFNKYGYVLTTNSPQTDSNYAPNASYPNWIYDVWYEVTVKASAFGAAGFGQPVVSGVHASPSKTGSNTEAVVVTPCPQFTASCAASSGFLGVAYSSSIAAHYGTAPYTFAMASGSLPPGLTLDPTTGIISGTPTTEGSYPYSVTVTDAAGLTYTTSSCGISITTQPPALSIVSENLGAKEVQITILNSSSADVFVSGLTLTWPTANGKLMQVKLDGDIIYDTPDVAPPSVNLTLANLVADSNKRKIQAGTSDVLHLVFEKNVDTNPAHYSNGLLSCGANCSLIIP